jgi:hypothetical protein
LISPDQDQPSEACTTRPNRVSCARPSRAINAAGPARHVMASTRTIDHCSFHLHCRDRKGRENNPPVYRVRTYASLYLARPGPYVHVCHVLQNKRRNEKTESCTASSRASVSTKGQKTRRCDSPTAHRSIVSRASLPVPSHAPILLACQPCVRV